MASATRLLVTSALLGNAFASRLSFATTTTTTTTTTSQRAPDMTPAQVQILNEYRNYVMGLSPSAASSSGSAGSHDRGTALNYTDTVFGRVHHQSGRRLGTTTTTTRARPRRTLPATFTNTSRPTTPSGAEGTRAAREEFISRLNELTQQVMSLQGLEARANRPATVQPALPPARPQPLSPLSGLTSTAETDLALGLLTAASSINTMQDILRSSSNRASRALRDATSTTTTTTQAPGLPRQMEKEDVLAAFNSMSIPAELQTEILESLTCPISLDIMTDPVMMADGFTYERSEIMRWLAHNRATSPVTRQPFEHTYMVRNMAVWKMLIKFEELTRPVSLSTNATTTTTTAATTPATTSA